MSWRAVGGIGLVTLFVVPPAVRAQGLPQKSTVTPGTGRSRREDQDRAGADR